MASETILRTKLFAPPSRRNLVIRRRLLERLTCALDPDIRLALVCAPAGFGKSTIVAEWLAGLGKPEIKAAWLTLDESDNEPVRFWRYIDAALQTIDPRLGEKIRPGLYAPQPPPFQAFLTDLANDILSAGQELVLVLDDYHLVQDETIHEAINFLIDHLPPLAHLVVVTRSDPPLQLARRRGRGELCELRAADLRFTDVEAAQFVNDVMRLDLSSSDVAALESRTEGWIAGLQMAALSLQDVSDPHAFVAAFRGNDRYIADYLVEEVLQRQPVEFQHFMLHTSILDRLSGPLCNAVTGRNDSQSVLNTLERANLFVLPLDNRREWFRYHPLFASLLQQRLLDLEGADAVLELKRRASRWHASYGDVVEAVEIALSNGDHEEAISIIEVSDASLFMSAHLNTLRQWSERIPTESIARHPRLNLMVTWASHATGQPRQAERFVQVLERSIGVSVEDFLENNPPARNLTTIQRTALLEGSVVRARIAADSLEFDKAFHMGERALPYLVNNPTEPFAFNPPVNLRCVVLFCLGLAHLFKGELAEAARLLAEAEIEALERKNQHVLALAIGHLGEAQWLQGMPVEARATFERAIAAAQAAPQSSAFWGLAYAGLGELDFEIGDIRAAETNFQTGIELGKIWSAWECLLPAMTGLARLKAAAGDWTAAHAILDELLERTASYAFMVRPAVDGLRALFQLKQGNLAAAAQWASTFDAAHPSPYRLQWDHNTLIAAEIWLAEGKPVEAEALLSSLQADAESAGRRKVVEQIQSIHRPGKPVTQQPANAPGMVEPLTDRELEVLRLMAGGLSNPEIARKLYLSPNTLKAHAQNIYQKLDVHNRMEAVNKARQLKLL